jgi:vacuolar protein-sorting-associated protein 4
MEHREKAVSIVQRAIEADRNGDKEGAFSLYLQSFQWFELALKYEKNEETSRKLRVKLSEYIKRAEELKPPTVASKNVDGVSWNDICGLEEAKQILQQTVIMPIRQPQLFKNARPWKGILLYGPPGTGKSFLAKAVATESKATFFSISVSDIVSKWVGESEKHVKALFDNAREHKPSIIFIDEVESLCAQRADDPSGNSSARLVTEFLVQMDGVGNSMDGILILGATNLPWLLDQGIRRRFEQRIYIPLPDVNARLKMFKGNKKLAMLTEGYSGADISIIINKAQMQPIGLTQKATHFKKIGGGYIACSPGDPEAIEMNWMDVEPGKLLAPSVKDSDYEKSIHETKPSVSDVSKYIEWSKEFQNK